MNGIPALSPLTLGTAQFGAPYGIVNDIGCPSDEALHEIMAVAAGAGFRYLDTARSYGIAEQRLGSSPLRDSFGYVSKVPEMTESRSAADQIEESISASLAFLNVDRIDIVLFHHGMDAFRPGAMAALSAHAARGKVGEIGVSVYRPDDAIACLQEPEIRHIQLPINVLDGRWFSSDFQQALARRPDVAIHARSIFLQGLLLNEAARWPSWVDEAELIGAKLDEVVHRSGCNGRLHLCLSFIRSIPWIRTTVIGVDTAEQLRSILKAQDAAKPLDESTLVRLRRLSETLPERILLPYAW